jgi:hypothetical protein
MQGIETYNTKESFRVVKVHYTADPDKSTEQAISELLKGYPGGRTGPAWRKEMEIDFTAYSGQLLCYNIIQEYRHKIIMERPIQAHFNKYGSLDWGRNNPASFHTYIVEDKKHIHSGYEIYGNGMSVADFATLIKASPFYKELCWISADPSIWNKTQETKQGIRSLADLFQDEGISLVRGKSRDDTYAINELLDRWYKLDEKEPRYTISPRCPKQIWELERLRYKELSTAMVDKANPEEQLVDKDNHAWDDFKYFVSTWISEGHMDTTIKSEKGSVAWEMEQEEMMAKDWKRKYN